MTTAERPSAPGDLRVLDLGGGPGAYCTKLLADLGADVILIEPPTGDPTRGLGPFLGGQPDPEGSLFFWHFHTSKRSVTLDLHAPEGRELFLRLAERADIIIEAFPPGALATLGLGYDALRAENPGLILTSITGFGQTGPYAGYQAHDLIALAAGGQLYLAGFPDAPPVRPGGFQGWQQASLHAAYSTLIALASRDLTGEGQQVDVSMQAAVAADLQNTLAIYEFTGEVRQRVGSRLLTCKDGYVRAFPSRGWDELVAWMDEAGMADDLGDLKNPRWQDPEIRRTEEWRFNEIVGRFFAGFTKAEILEQALRRRIPVVPSNTAEDLAHDPHLNEREWFVPVDHPEHGRSFTYPGAPFRMSETPWRIRRRAPLLGEDNEAVYLGDLGLSPAALAELRQAGVV